MKEYTIQYFDEQGRLIVAHEKGYSLENAIDRFEQRQRQEQTETEGK